MDDSKPGLGVLGFFLLGPKPPKSLGEFFVRLLIVLIVVGILYLIGMGMLQSFIEGFQP